MSATMRLPRKSIIIVMLLVTIVVTWGIVQINKNDSHLATEMEEGSESDEVLDAIFVLMGGQTEDKGVPLWVQRRLDRAVKLQMERRTSEGGLPPIVSVGAGTPGRRPNLTEDKFIWFESNSGAEYLNKTRNVDFRLLLKEYTSYDTLGNGYFSLIQYAIPAGWRSNDIITSEFQLPRTEDIFERIYGLPGPGAGLDCVHLKIKFLHGSQSQGFALEYHSVSDKGLDEDALERRKSAETTLFKAHHYIA